MPGSSEKDELTPRLFVAMAPLVGVFGWLRPENRPRGRHIVHVPYLFAWPLGLRLEPDSYHSSDHMTNKDRMNNAHIGQQGD